MPHSPANPWQAPLAHEFQARRKELSKLVKQGKSWSGRERNCCFLNVGGSRFASVAATSGFDYADDARGMGLIDWDFDGDTDVWVVNRTAPQVRFLRNDIGQQNRFLAVRLQGDGKTCNRDAIGARLELTVRFQDQSRTQIATLRAGEGFLSQNSKWIRFGIGQGTPERLVVRWPGGAQQQFTNLPLNDWLEVRQGRSDFSIWSPPTSASALRPSPAEKRSGGQSARAWLSSRPYLPLVDYQTLDGEKKSLQQHDLKAEPKGLLLTLWSAECGVCEEELPKLQARRKELEQAGLSLLLLSVDRCGEAENAEQLVSEATEQMELSLPVGHLSRRSLEKIELLRETVFSLPHEFVTPTSLLLDRQGQVAAIYYGRIPHQQLLADSKRLSLDRTASRSLETPFAGRWRKEKYQGGLSPLVNAFHDAGFPEDSQRFLTQAAFEQASYLALDATQIAAQGKQQEAKTMLLQAVKLAPQHAQAHCNLGAACFELGEAKAAKRHLERALALDDSLAAAHHTLGVMCEADDPQQAARRYQAAIAADPEYADAHQNLAVLYLRQAADDKALKHLRAILDIDPDRHQIAVQLARLLATHPDENVRDPQEAIRLAEPVRRLYPGEPMIVDALAAAYAAAGQFAKAAEAAEQAKRLAERQGEYQAVLDIGKRLEQYRKKQPYREDPRELLRR